jgi:hypothetical protein
MRQRVIRLLMFVAVMLMASPARAGEPPPLDPAMTLPADSIWSADTCSDWYQGEYFQWEFTCYLEGELEGEFWFYRSYFFWNPDYQISDIYRYQALEGARYWDCWIPGACDA